MNILVYGLCVMQAGQADIPVELLFRYGAMYSGAFERGEYWRMITAGFLHAGPLHILGNMLCLMLWGGPLERRLGALYFTLIYLAGLVGGAIVSAMTHPVRISRSARRGRSRLCSARCWRCDCCAS